MEDTQLNFKEFFQTQTLKIDKTSFDPRPGVLLHKYKKNLW